MLDVHRAAACCFGGRTHVDVTVLKMLEHLDIKAAALGVVPNHLESLRRYELGDVDHIVLRRLASVDAHCAGDCLGRCCRRVVHRNVCHRQAYQFAHHRLELPHGLQHALADLGLVGRV